MRYVIRYAALYNNFLIPLVLQGFGDGKLCEFLILKVASFIGL